MNLLKQLKTAYKQGKISIPVPLKYTCDCCGIATNEIKIIHYHVLSGYQEFLICVICLNVISENTKVLS